MLVNLDEKQLETIRSSLRWDHKTTREAFGALPIGAEMQAEIEDAFQALKPAEPETIEHALKELLNR